MATAAPAIKNLPVAKAIFPTLQRYAALRPRPTVWGPIDKRDTEDNLGEVWRTIPFLYHDLGVLAFAGASPSQITRIGDILEGIVSFGGLAELSAYLQWSRSRAALRASRWKAPALDKNDVLTSRDPSLDNILSPTAAARIGAQAVKKRIVNMLKTVEPLRASEIDVRQRSIVYHKDPPPRSIKIHLATGPRRLPIYVLTNITINPRHTMLLVGEARLYAGNEMAGSCHFLFALLKPWINIDGSIQMITIKPRQIFTKEHLRYDLPRGSSFKDPWGPDQQDRRVRQYEKLTDEIFRPLWYLEDEIYGDQVRAYMENEELRKQGEDEEDGYGLEQDEAPERYESQKRTSLGDRISRLGRPRSWFDEDQWKRNETMLRLARKP